MSAKRIRAAVLPRTYQMSRSFCQWGFQLWQENHTYIHSSRVDVNSILWPPFSLTRANSLMTAGSRKRSRIKQERKWMSTQKQIPQSPLPSCELSSTDDPPGSPPAMFLYAMSTKKKKKRTPDTEQTWFHHQFNG